jgi:DNA-directed RNA polymerase subunit M/transcription elongation factor TFIIS
MLRTHISTLIGTQLESLSEAQQIDLERGIYNASLESAKVRGIRCHWENPDFAEVYKMTARRSLSNLNPDTYVGNGRLLARLLEGEFEPHRVPFMDARELYPEHWQAMGDEQLKRETTMLAGPQQQGSSLFTCKKCGKSRTNYYQQQTRSADEPMTVFIQCLNCGKEWRQ